MIIVRRYKKLDWWSFLDQIEIELSRDADVECFIELADELRLRMLECVSEGGLFKLKAPAKNLKKVFDERKDKDIDFAKLEEIDEFNEIINSVID